ncbi:MAG TPA: hypothetical protein DC058_12625, partial [Planctomycetaceae bacterium]|nr:hypothetical protein [Planctomycetaceae bacterium]
MQIDLSLLFNAEICHNQPQITNLFLQPDCFVVGFAGNHKVSAQEFTPFFVPYFHRVQRICLCRPRFLRDSCRKQRTGSSASQPPQANGADPPLQVFASFPRRLYGSVPHRSLCKGSVIDQSSAALRAESGSG